MGYSLYIERESEEIESEEWIEAVISIEEAKTDNSDTIVINPKTNEIVSFDGIEEDVSILFETEDSDNNQKWIKCIYFMNGRGLFRYQSDLENPYHPVRVVASKLANLLDAKIIGDEGEIYDW